MKFLAIDPGYDKVGYAVFDKIENGTSDFTYITSDLIKTPPKDLHEARLLAIYERLSDVIKECSIELMVLESLFMFKNQKTVLKVAQAIGVIELAGAMHNLPIVRLTPLQIKQIVTGYGTADKASVLKMIRLTLADKIVIKDDDQADAIACGLAYCYYNNALS